MYSISHTKERVHLSIVILDKIKKTRRGWLVGQLNPTGSTPKTTRTHHMSIIKSWNNKSIRIRADRYVNLTDMAQACGKRYPDWIRLEGSKSYLATLSAVVQIPTTELIQVNQGGTPELQGTWGHPKVAIRFAQWCSDSFAVQVDTWIDELLTTGQVQISTESQPQLPPKRDAIDYVQASHILENLKNPILRSLLEQRMMEELTPTNKLLTGQNQEKPICVITSVRAAQLGYTEKQIDGGSRLGKFVLKQGLKPVGKVQHGKYPVNVYELTEELDNAIHAYFS